jgi:ATP-dependent RNA helicase DBP3
MASSDIEDKKRKHDENGDVVSKKSKKDKKDKKEKKEKKEKKDKKEKKEKKSKKEESVSEPASAASTNTSAVKVSQEDIDKFLKDNEISIENADKLNIQPLINFESLKNYNIDQHILKSLSKFDKPSPIQASAWPYLFEGHDIVGVAETGSGKTLGFGIPAIQHIINSGKKGLQVLVVSPTRELATQIFDNLKELTDTVGLNAVCVYGGVPKDQQRKDILKSQCVIATPGRLVDFINDGSIKLKDVNYLVLDEADRMLEKGFEEDIKLIIKSVSNAKDRQTLMFTATWPKEVRELASGFMRNPIKVNVGNRDELTANKRIQQIVEVIDPYDKEKRLIQLLHQYQSKGENEKILIFALYKKEASRIEKTLKYKGFDVAALHGDLSQIQRQHALESFKKGECNLLLATDVAARGLDIPNVKVVINLTFPLTIEDYVHRIGRTGRAGKTGIAHTMFTEHEKHLAGALGNVLRGADQPVPEELLKFGSHTKKKEHGAYGAFFKNVDMSKKAKKITFD